MDKNHLTLSANALPGRGGQGLNLRHMIEALHEDFELQVYSQRTASNGTAYQNVAPSWRAALLGRVPLLRRLRDWQTWYSDVDFDRQVARALGKGDLFQGVTGQCLESLRAARRAGCRSVLDVVTTHIEFLGEGMDRECGRFGTRAPLGHAMRARMVEEYRQADAVRVMSHVAKATFVERGFPAEKIMVATPPFSLEEFPQAELQHSVFRVCFVGLVEPWKGFHYLVDAFHAAAIPDGELVFWGGAGARSITNYLREQSAKNSRIQVRPVDIRSVGYAKVYGEASVFVHPSVSDGFGYVVGEAMACGLPVIVTSCSGAADLVRDGVNGYVVRAGDIDAIRDRLVHLANNPSLGRSMGASARATIQSLTPESFRRPMVAKMKELLHG